MAFSFTRRIKQALSWRLLPLFIGAWLTCCVTNASAADDHQNEILETTLAGLKRNDQQIGALRCEIVQRLIDPNVQKSSVREFKNPDGGSAIVRRAPETVFKILCVIDGPRLRHEIISDGDTQQYLVFDGSEWMQYNPEGKRAWKREPGQTKGMMIDPRMLGLPEEHGSVVDAIRSGTLVSAEIEDQHVLLSTEDAAGRMYSFSLDATRNYLPSRISYWHKTGGLRTISEFSYQPVPTRSGWFLKQATVRGVKPSDRAKNDVANPVYIIDTKVSSLELLGSDVANSLFHVELPDGVVVHDNVNKTVTVVGTPSAPSPR